MSGRKFTLTLVLLDALSVVIAFNAMAWLRGQLPVGTLILTPLLTPVLLAVAALYLIDGYKDRTDMISAEYASQHVIALLLAMLTTLLLTFVVFPEGYQLQGSRAVVALGFLAMMVASLGFRRLIYLRANASRRRRRIVFIGDAASCHEFEQDCQRHELQHQVFYSLLEGPDPASTSGADAGSGGTLELRQSSEVLQRLIAGELEVEAIVLRESGQQVPDEVARELEQLYFSGVPVYTLELFHQLYWRKIPLYRLNQVWLFQEGFQIARDPVFERIKRASDIGFALAGLLIFAPLIAVAAVGIWIEDRGPVFFRQSRIGRDRLPFLVVKLRTMRVNSGTGDQRYTEAADARITRMGEWLRAARIDELPQLWNVLRGEMSMIGPRPEWDRLVREYAQQIPCYHFRHLVRPGITGWAQVNYPYGASLDDTRRKLEYDLFYIRHFSFLMDASIVVKTIHTMLFGKGR